MRMQTTKTVTPAQRQRQIIYVVLVVFVAFMVFRSCAPHGENTFEKNAHRVTEAIQKNDAASVSSLFDAQSREAMTKARFGKASDDLAPLGKIDSVHETTPSDAAARTHVIVVTAEKGSVTERFRYDIDGKIDRFKYDGFVPTAK